jgi:hypothetical protein
MWSAPLIAVVSLLPAGEAPRVVDTPEAPYAAWGGERHAPPPPLADERGPGPLPEQPELARRTFELVPELGVSFPHCAGSHGPSGCDALVAGTELGLSALYRVSPYFAVGASGGADAYTFSNARGSEGRALFAGVTGRVYFLESGAWDPYLELTLGAGSLAAFSGENGSRAHDRVALAPAARVAAGIDFALGPWLRAGPLLALSRYSAATAQRCSGRACGAVPLEASSVPIGATSFALRLTVSAGDVQ